MESATFREATSLDTTTWRTSSRTGSLICSIVRENVMWDVRRWVKRRGGAGSTKIAGRVQGRVTQPRRCLHSGSGQGHLHLDATRERKTRENQGNGKSQEHCRRGENGRVDSAHPWWCRVGQRSDVLELLWWIVGREQGAKGQGRRWQLLEASHRADHFVEVSVGGKENREHCDRL